MAQNIRQYFNQGTGLYVFNPYSSDGGNATPPPVVIPGDNLWSSNTNTLYPTNLN